MVFQEYNFGVQMSDIAIGSVVIQDVNQNNLFDSGLDGVVDPLGQPFSPVQEAAELHQITQELGASSWKGIFLSDAAVMVNGLRDADAAAQQGHVSKVEFHLKAAERGAQNLGLSFPQTRADLILESALRTGMGENFQNADAMAQAGQNINEVEALLNEAAAHHQRLQSQFNFPAPFDQIRADSILKDAFQNGIPVLERDAQIKAAAGDFFGTLSGFQDLKRLIPTANQKFGFTFQYNPAQAQRAVGNAFQIGHAQIYQNIHQAALRGQAIWVRHRLRNLENQINTANSEFQLSLAFDSKQADLILADALINGIPDNFKLAKSAAQGRSPRLVRRWLDLARSYVVEYNQKFANPGIGKPKLVFDLALANTIMACAHGRASCP